MLTRTGVEEVLLARRAGFVKLALSRGSAAPPPVCGARRVSEDASPTCVPSGAALVPCYAFGTVDLYSVSGSQHGANSQGLLWTLHKRLGVALPRYSGSCGFLPKRGEAAPRAPTPAEHTATAPHPSLLEVHASSPAGRCDLVFGAPIEAQCATPGEPSESEVAAAHATYIAALKAFAGRQRGAARLGCGGVTGTSTLLGALRGTQGAAWLRRPRAARGVRRPAGPVPDVRREAARVARVYRHAIWHMCSVRGACREEIDITDMPYMRSELSLLISEYNLVLQSQDELRRVGRGEACTQSGSQRLAAQDRRHKRVV